jgi:hypothetical protein
MVSDAEQFARLAVELYEKPTLTETIELVPCISA